MTNQISQKAIVLFLALALGFPPILSYAHDNDNGNNNRRQDSQGRLKHNDDDHDDDDKEDREEEREQKKEDRKQNKSCRKAFKNLFKSGNLGNNTANFYIECLRSVGFEATFTGQATSTPDTTAPVITNLSVSPATTTATITWHTNENADSAVFWSTSPSVNVNSASSASESAKIVNHEITISSLTASTTYYLIARSRDTAGNTATSSEISFHTTISIVVPPDTTAPIITNVATQVGSSTIQVSWNTDEPATSKVYYGTSSDLSVATSTSFIENLTLTLNHLISFISLLPQTVYYFLVRSVDGSGNATTTPLVTATTTAI